MKHGMSRTPYYQVWSGMIQRCTNPNDRNYASYGGRGITVCERWLKFENFLQDMGERPDGCSIDRKNNDGNYEPSNCRWATDEQQSLNRQDTLRYTHEGVTKPLKVWCKELGLSYTAAWKRHARGLPPLAVEKPTAARLVTINGKTQSISAWEREFGLKPGRVRAREVAGWDLVEAILTPLIPGQKNHKFVKRDYSKLQRGERGRYAKAPGVTQ